MKWIKSIAVVMMLISSLAVFAQPQKSDPESRARNYQNEEVRTYVRENVIPVLLVQRQKLELLISDQDQEKIAELRAWHHKHAGNTRPSPKSRTNIREEVRPLMETYGETIKQLLEEINDQRETWRADLRELHQNRPDTALSRRGHDKASRRSPEKEMVRFLLMDPEGKAAKDSSSGAVFPNPAQSRVNIKFDQAQRGIVTVALLDRTGSVQDLIAHEVMDRGNHKIEYDVTPLSPGLYFIQIMSDQGSEEFKLVRK